MAVATLAFSVLILTIGTATALNVPMIASVTSSSKSVKALDTFLRLLPYEKNVQKDGDSTYSYPNST